MMHVSLDAIRCICIYIYIYWYSLCLQRRLHSIVRQGDVPISSKHIQRHCSVGAVVLLWLVFEKRYRDVYGANELGRRRASATTYHAGKLGRGWLHFKLWQMTGVWRIPSFLAAGTTTAKRFGCVAEGTTKAGWYRASGGRVLGGGFEATAIVEWDGMNKVVAGCWTTLAKVEHVFTMESSKSSKRWDYFKSMDADGIWWNSQNENLQKAPRV